MFGAKNKANRVPLIKRRVIDFMRVNTTACI